MDNNKIIIEKSASASKSIEHFHNAHEIIYISQGRVSANISGKKYEVGEGSLIFISNLEIHQIESLFFPYTRFFLLLPNDKLNMVAVNTVLRSVFTNRNADFVHCINVNDYRDIIEDFFNKMHFEYSKNEELSDDYISSYLKQLLIFLYRNKKEAFPQPKSSVEDIIYKVKEYIEENYSEDITVSEISKKFYLSNFYLTHSFKKATGYNPKQFIMLCRLAQSRALLYNTNKSIADVAVQTGFLDVNNFIRYFKKEVGLTPSQYRKTARIH